jgi:hypothetical protein
MTGVRWIRPDRSLGRPLLLLSLCCALAAASFFGVSPARAEAGSWVGEIPGAGPDYTVFTVYHGDTPERGIYTVVVINSGTEAWGDFHFRVFDPVGGQPIGNVGFLDAAAGGVDPTSSQSGLTWDIDNEVVGATISLYFCTDPVGPGEAAWFSVYIDNPDHLSFFGVAFYPSPVPPMGACCFNDGRCALTCEMDCPDPGIWHGEWTACDPNPCPQPPPKGACCDLATGGCAFVTQDECRHGEWQYGSFCDPTIPCRPPVPTQSTTWGAIKATFR